MRKHWFGAIWLLTVVVVLVIGAPQSVIASTVFHSYSTATDSGRWVQGSRWYSGVSVVHYDPALTLPVTTQQGCGHLMVHPNVYETMWVSIDPLGGSYPWDWVEGGTYHQTCPDGSEYKAWYAQLWTFNFTTGVMNPPQLMAQVPVSTSAQRRFFLVQGNSNGSGCGTSAWNFFVQNGGSPVEYGCANFPNLGFADQFGMESWDDTCSPYVPGHSYVAGLDTTNWGSWENWLPDGGTSGWYLYDTFGGPPYHVEGAYSNSTDGWAGQTGTC